ncbi:chemotaxis protein CheW [Schlegelella sp. S2-27]|uniref:Chemotaxis protein CheW n=1 Tax=Caldimonas mangrovi TaxID=2944811 RepID=A0ABT0YNC1_9BURK|nr:chemotaxis protein CheW [Caldimonas mangrovi]MCM5680215.1 chemotaxis protein CheW [Caldimonas mangrovi]
MSSKRTVKGIAFDSHVAELVGHMESVGDYRESLQRLQDVWDQLTLLGETSGIAADITATGGEFRSLTDTLLDALARRQLDNTLRQLRGRAQVAIDLLVRNLFERTADVGFLAVDAVVRAHVEARASQRHTEAMRGELEARFRAYVAKYSVYDDVAVLSRDGEVLARLDRSCRATHCAHALVQQSLQGEAGFVESFGAIDVLDGRRGLVYSAPIRGGHNERALGVLCLSFRFDDEMSRVFEQVAPAGQSACVLALLAEDGTVLASSDPWQIPANARLQGGHDHPHLLRFAGREYLAVRTSAHAYQGYAGPGWQVCALVPLALAFGRTGTTQASDVHMPAEALDHSPLFDEELRRIPAQAHRIQRGLERSVWNGRVRGRAKEHGATSPGRFAAALLRQVTQTGERVERVFERAIGELQQSAVAGLTEEVRASAALAVDILDRNLYERANDCRWWALDPTLQQAAAGLRPAAEATGVLVHINSLYTVYSQLVLLDRDGQLLASSSTGQPDDRARQTIEGRWVRPALALPDAQAWARSRFEPHMLYGSRPTYIYAATVRHDQQPCGAVAIVFDSEPQLHAMLADALPRDANGAPLAQASALFVTREGRVIASTDPAFAVGQDVPFRDQLATLARGASRQLALELSGTLYAVGFAMSAGYREYDSSLECGPDDVAGVMLLRVCAQASAAAPALPAGFEPPPPAPGAATCEIASFRCGGQWLGLKTADVIEAVEVPRITALPGDAPHLAGVVLRDGEPVPVVQLDALRGAAQPQRSGLVVVCRTPAGPLLGLLVDELGSVIEVGATALQPLPAYLAAHDPLATAIVRGADGRQPMLTLLDPARIAAGACAPATALPGSAALPAQACVVA